MPRVLSLPLAATAATAMVMGFDVESVAFANANRARIVGEINADPASPWIAAVPLRFRDTSYSRLLRDGAGVLGGDPRENAAGLRVKMLQDIDVPPSAIPATFQSADTWPQCSVIKEVQDQSACGSCYAVSAASAATDRFCIARNGTKSPRLSANDLMSCCFTCKGANGGCYGGTPSHCWDYMTQQGIASGGAYGDHAKCLMYPFPPCSHHVNGTYPACADTPYDSPTCLWKCDALSREEFDQSQAAHKFTSSYKLDNNIALIQADIMKHGPVQASMFLVPEFEVYKAGVFTTKNTDYIGAHAVKIVGWGNDSGMDYWTVQNSWNSEWGEDGYFRIQRGKNILAIEDSIVAGAVL